LSSGRSDLRALRDLTLRERGRLVGAAFVLPAAYVLLRTIGYARTVRLGERLAGHRAPPVDAEARASSTNRLVAVAASRLPLPTTCLSRCIALWFLLRLQGVATEIEIGVRAGGEPLDAHAWVVRDGRVLNDLEDVRERYQVLPPARRG
jgi:hypothetical protein